MSSKLLLLLPITCLLFTQSGSAAAAKDDKDDDDNGKIVGGEEAVQDQFPYQVSLQKQMGVSSFHFCGGSVYNERTVVTAAHCCEDVVVLSLLVIVAGELDFASVSGKEQTVAVDEIVIHPHYNPYTIENDVCILKLQKNLVHNSSVKNITMASSDPVATSNCFISGWGTLREGGITTPDDLMYAKIPILKDTDCSNDDTYGSHYYPNTMLCAGVLSGGIDSCQGDSGGPLVCDDEQVGIVSFGKGCAQPGMPGVYTRVSHFNSWIVENAAEPLSEGSMTTVQSKTLLAVAAISTMLGSYSRC